MLISKKFYGTFHKWHKILAANPTIKPNYLQIGEKIILPDLAPEVAQDIEDDSFSEESVLSIVYEQAGEETPPGYFSDVFNWFTPESKEEEKWLKESFFGEAPETEKPEESFTLVFPPMKNKSSYLFWQSRFYKRHV